MYIPARDSAESPVLSIALKVKQLWFVGGAIVTVIVGIFAFGMFIQGKNDATVILAKNREISELTRKNAELLQAVTALTKRLEGVFGEKEAVTTKAEFLNRLTLYLQERDDISNKLLVDVVCSMWKESQKRKIRLERGPLEIRPSDQGGLPPDLEKILITQGISEQQLSLIRNPLPKAGKPNTVDRVRRERDDVLKIARGISLVKIIRFSDESFYELPREIAIAVYLNSECAPI